MTPEPPSENRNGWIYLSVVIIVSIIALLYMMSSVPFPSVGAGSTAPVMNHKTTVTKISPAGHQEWQAKIPGIGDPVKVLSTTDGGYAIYGSFGDPKEQYPALQIVKMSKDGTVEWDFLKGMYAYGSPISLGDPLMLFAENSSYTVFTDEGILIHINSQGKEQWHQNYPHNTYRNIISTNDGGYILSGSTYGYYDNPNGTFVGEYTGIILSLDNSGNIRWQRKDRGYQGCDLLMEQTNGTTLTVCSTGSWDTKPSPFEIRALDSHGTILWKQNLKEAGIQFPPNADNDPGVSFVQKSITKGKIDLVVNSYSSSAIGTTILDQVQPGQMLEVYKVLPTSDGGYLILSGVKK